MRLPKNFNELTSDQQRDIVASEIKKASSYLSKLQILSRKLVLSNSFVKVEERPDDSLLKDTHIKDAR
jgi:hypothetical protein